MRGFSNSGGKSTMKKQLTFGFLLMAITAGTVLARAFEPVPVSPRRDNDAIQPIPALNDDGSTLDLNQPQNTLTTAAVPEPSTLSLLAGSAIIGSWFCLRRRRR